MNRPAAPRSGSNHARMFLGVPLRFGRLSVLAAIMVMLAGVATVSGWAADRAAVPAAGDGEAVPPGSTAPKPAGSRIAKTGVTPSPAAAPVTEPAAARGAAAPGDPQSQPVMGSFRLIASDASGVTLEYAPARPVFADQDTPFGRFQVISITGHGVLIDLGRPALPTAGVGIAVPEGVDPRITWEILESHEYAGVRPAPSPDGTIVDPDHLQRKDGAALDEGIYDGAAAYPATMISFNDLGHLRSHRVGQVSIIPVQFDPKSGSVTIIGKARIRVDFAPPRKRTAEEAATRYVPVGEERAWEDTYRNTFLNYEAAKGFRVRRLPEFGSELLPDGRPGSRAGVAGPEGAGRTGGGPGGGGLAVQSSEATITGSEFRIYVGATGFYYASCSDLSLQAGWPADVPLNQIRFYEKSYNAATPRDPLIREVPITIVESGTPDSLFNGDDYFYFYGLNFNDRFRPTFADARYTHLHVYWLARGDAPTARIPARSGWYDAAAFTTPANYVHHTRWEENYKYNFIRPASGAGSPESLMFPEVDTHYWLDATSSLDSLDFTTPGRDPSKPFRLQATWQGVFSNVHYVTIWLTRGSLGVTSDTLLLYRQPFNPEAAYSYDSGFTLPGARLADGANRLKLGGNGFGGNPETAGSGAYFNFFDVDYYRNYVAVGGFLRFTSGSALGDVEFAIRGLIDTTAIAFDVTDSLAPVEIRAPHFQQLSGPPSREYELRFRAPVDRQRTYVLYSSSAIPPVTRAVPVGKMPADLGTKNIQRDDNVDVTGAGHADADVIVLAHPKFQAALTAWKARREAPPYNHHVWIVSPQDVWDQFSGGHKSVPAFRTWLRYIYRSRTTPPDYLMMFGDANEDYTNDSPTSDEDWVSTMMMYGPVPGPDVRLQLVASDNYFVGALAPGSPDWDVYPDMHLGRLSVGTTDEADAVMAKLVAYDNYYPNDAWRNRGLIVSDDRYSSGITSSSRYQFNAYESLFVEGADSLARMFNETACYTDFDVQQFRLEDVLKDAPCNLGRTYGTAPENPDIEVTMDCARRYAAPIWVDMASRGGLFQIYSGHGNRFVLTTEYLVRFRGDFPTSPDDHTIEKMTNYGKPFIFVGAGCHLNQYEFYQERDSKAAIAEEMVLLPGRGAIASIASSAYEWVPTNKPVELYVGKTLFSNHPRDPVTGRPRRILGEGFDQAMIRMSNELGGGPQNNSWYRDCLKTYCLLGDPTMQIDMAPPRLRVSVDGAPVDTGAVVNPAPGAGTIRITARLSDDVDYRTGNGFSIEENGVPVPADRYTITPVNDAAEGACRGADIEYVASLQPANYPITLRAKDWIGREMTFTINVRMQLGYFSNGVEIHNGDRISVDQPLEVRITSPAELASGDIRVLLNGEEGHFSVTGSGRNWIATNNGALPEGSIAVETFVLGHSLGTLTVEAQRQMAFDEVYFFPNPWEGHGPGRFTYQLSYATGERPRSARVSVFTVSGRKVITLDGTVETGRNQVEWDMRDAAGDGLANGVYLFKLVLETASGQKRTTIDRLVVHR